MTQTQLFTVIRQFFGQANVLTVPVVLLKKLNGDHAAALFLGQLIYWADKTSNPDGWIRKSYTDWETELLIKRDKAIAIKKTLEGFGLIETRVLKTTAAPVVHYRVKEDALLAFLFNNPDTPSSDDSSNPPGDNPPPFGDSQSSAPSKTPGTTTGNSRQDSSGILQSSESPTVDSGQFQFSIVGNSDGRQSEKPTIDSRQNQQSTGYIDYNIDYSINNTVFPPEKPAALQKIPKGLKTKKPPLRIREPENEYEQVEKVYMTIWDELYDSNIVFTQEPVINFTQTRTQLKRLFRTVSPETIISALHAARNDRFILEGGYSLGTILSTSVLNRLLNAHYTVPEQKYSPYRKSAVIASDVLGPGDYL